jgi:hypothetical protein
MADISKRLMRKLAAHLAEDERIEVAVLVEPRGTYGLGMLKMVASPRAGARRIADKASEAHRDAGGMAADFPGEPAAIVVTDSRVLVVPGNGLRFGDPAMTIGRGSLLVRSTRWMGLGRRIELVFADGTVVVVDASMGQPFGRLAAALGRAP